MNHRLVSPFIMWAIVAIGFAAVWIAAPRVTLFHRNVFTAAALALALLHWLYFFSGALATNRSAARSAAGVSSLITTGVYARVRHPIYSADIIVAWAVFLNFPTLRVLLGIVWMTAVLVAWMKVEERALEQRFGEDYASYKRRTPMIIPRYW